MRAAIVVPDAPAPHLRETIAELLRQDTHRRTGLLPDFRDLALLLEDRETRALVGGLWGWTGLGQAHIEFLFVPHPLRGAGLGRQLMGQAEDTARQRGCRGIWLETYSFQAVGFYERLGYPVFGEIPDYLPGHRRVFMRRALTMPA